MHAPSDQSCSLPSCLAYSIYQEIWKSGKLYEYPVSNLDNVQSVKGPLTDGWGVTTDQSSLIMSDGSSTLSWVDPASQTVTKTIKVGFAETSFSNRHVTQSPGRPGRARVLISEKEECKKKGE